jgi:putative phage-type endonuclease
MLTSAQREIRRTGIGASEISELFEMHPKKAAIDLWLRKTGKAETANDNEEEENPVGDVGSFLEDGVRALFEKRTGKRLARPGPVTLRHPDVDCVLASPDDLVADEDAGLEIKVVGARMLHHWEGDTLPDYVRLQCAQNMAVANRSRWYVAALLGGTNLQILTVRRDLELETTMLEEADRFWRLHVLSNVPPPIPDPEARRRYLRERYPGSGKNTCRKVGDDAMVADLMRRLVDAKAAHEISKEVVKSIENDLLELVGDDYGIEGIAGKFIAPKCQGAVSWKALAEELAIGTMPEALIEKHRGEGFRSPRFYAPKKGA